MAWVCYQQSSSKGRKSSVGDEGDVLPTREAAQHDSGLRFFQPQDWFQRRLPQSRGRFYRRVTPHCFLLARATCPASGFHCPPRHPLCRESTAVPDGGVPPGRHAVQTGPTRRLNQPRSSGHAERTADLYCWESHRDWAVAFQPTSPLKTLSPYSVTKSAWRHWLGSRETNH